MRSNSRVPIRLDLIVWLVFPAVLLWGNAGSLPAAVLIAPAGATASSQLADNPSYPTIDRRAVYAVNGAGLTGSAHTASPEGTMWLTDFNDTDPWFKVDLGGTYNLDFLRLWNYNEGPYTNRSVLDADVYVSATGLGTPATNPADWTQVLSHQAFGRAPGNSAYDTPTYVGLGGAAGSHVLFDINSNFGSDVAGNFYGLSEVQFYQAVSQAGLLFSDNFQSGAPASHYPIGYGLNEELYLRQSGELRPTQYVISSRAGIPDEYQVNRYGEPNGFDAPGALSMFSQSGGRWAVLDRDFPRNVEVSVVVDPVTGDTASDEWGTLGVWGPGTDPADPVSFWNPGINLLVRSNGEWYLAVNGSIVTHDRVDAADEYLLDVMAAESHYSARINGQAIDVNGALPGTTLDLTPYLPGLGSSDYITLGAYVNGGAGYRQTTFDDLMVSEIPEPATWLLLACGAGCAVLPALIRRRAARRK